MARYLVDTCVWIDFFEAREKFGRFAIRFFAKNIESEILLSNAVLNELKNNHKNLAVLYMFRNLKRIYVTLEEFNEAERISNKRNLPLADCILAIQARNHDASVITRDKHFFYDLADIVRARHP